MIDSERPLIAINGEMSSGENPQVSLKNRYADAVLKAGGVPVVIPPVGGPSDIRRLLERVDGLVLSGGDDFDTARLGLGPTHAAAKPVPQAKQDFDVALAQAALELKVPTLGICYGMQLLGLVGGGTLYQHLPEEWSGKQLHSGGALHEVALEPGSRIARVVDRATLEVVSRHHQAVREVGAGWRVAARDAEGLVEALELPSHPFLVGVQWHPELAPEGTAHDRLFRALVFAAAARGIQRRYPEATAVVGASKA
ncbi:MAG: gamma-glutamyl-gamma-aminobutyrate hydrolase family protein [Planctomycetota bacterium]|nr:gamma-glutamyl-gamma-aminobutyrate hydrolase family protein [Planctomycetota bacterium]